MSYAMVRSVGLVGVAGHLVEVEADLANGLPAVALSGLPDTALHEARDRVRAAIVNSGQVWPNRRITVNLLPASLPKFGSSFDAAIACAVLAAAGELPLAGLAGAAVIGELGLDGSLRPVRGVLPMVLAAARAEVGSVIVPVANATEAALVPGVMVWGADTLGMLVRAIRGEGPLSPPPAPSPLPTASAAPDLAEVVGQATGRWAMEVAAAGGHHLAMVGPPGAGKTLLAQRLPTILPELDDEAALEVTALHSVAGALPTGAGLVRRPPFQAPHHSASMPALVGGGAGLARPGAISLAHRGVLFLDEAPEYSRRALDALRQPLEEGMVRLRRSAGETTYPARVQLVLAANPCPCARPSGDADCECTALVRRRYLGRLSGPLLDRIDVQLGLEPVSGAALFDAEAVAESSATVGARVAVARAAAVARWSAHGWRSNAEVPGSVLHARRWRPPPAVMAPARRLLDLGELSARGFHRVLRMAWTLCDLAGRSRPDRGDLAAATELRRGERW
ncbi:YifB family Mg chelatase-like AAA ATPase [Natronosporangium hydrolyticum]|uniref:YifB family Mg chelatase-like AAA ATPase n=1 Tax=Natronosporangium hydrolyticum TaxID=2811111 RepID=A0A895Y835_9ACTN|nr:YifB family Mg chelatase-like AAA ATPase [Natronosporangium hydrolyticum]QSB13511.1 YifB family Mg chelatase-like AAA ATPase [Natronosporangium hydrolyticum]